MEYPAATENEFVKDYLMSHKTDGDIVQSFLKESTYAHKLVCVI